MDRADDGNLRERARRARTTSSTAVRLAADHRFLGGVHDQDVHPLLARDCCSYRGRRSRHDARDPVNRLGRRKPPHAPRRLARTGQVRLKERRRPKPLEQKVAVGPGSESHKRRGLSHAVADRRFRNDPQSSQEVGQQTRNRHACPGSGLDGRRTIAAPSPFHQIVGSSWSRRYAFSSSCERRTSGQRAESARPIPVK